MSTRSDTNRAGKLQKIARGSKFRILEVEGLYYPCSENKGADQLCGYRTTGGSVALFFAYAKIQFSQNEAQLIITKILFSSKKY